MLSKYTYRNIYIQYISTAFRLFVQNDALSIVNSTSKQRLLLLWQYITLTLNLTVLVSSYINSVTFLGLVLWLIPKKRGLTLELLGAHSVTAENQIIFGKW